MGHNVLKIRPPLVLTAEQAEIIIDVLDQGLTDATAARMGHST